MKLTSELGRPRLIAIDFLSHSRMLIGELA